MVDRIQELRALLAGATPTPWGVNRHGAIDGGEAVEYVRGTAKPQVALATGGGSIDAEERDANSAIIVGAVNSLQTLLDVAEAARELDALLLVGSEWGVWTRNAEGDARRAALRLRTALAALKGKT